MILPDIRVVHVAVHVEMNGVAALAERLANMCELHVGNPGCSGLGVPGKHRTRDENVSAELVRAQLRTVSA